MTIDTMPKKLKCVTESVFIHYNVIVLYIKTQGKGISVYNRPKRWGSCNIQLNSFKSLPPMCEAGRSCTWQITALGVQVTASLEGRGVRLLETELRYAACRKSVPSRYLLRGGAAHYSVAFEQKWMRRAWKCALCVTHTHIRCQWVIVYLLFASCQRTSALRTASHCWSRDAFMLKCI